MSKLRRDNSAKQSRQNGCWITTLSLYALWAEVHARTQTARLSEEHAETSDGDVCRWHEPTQDWATIESSPSNGCPLGLGSCGSLTECSYSARRERSGNG